VQPGLKLLPKDEKRIAEAVILLQKRRNPKDLLEKVATETHLLGISDDILARADARLREQQQPLTKKREVSEAFQMKVGAGKTKTQIEADRAKFATRDTKAIEVFMKSLQSNLDACALQRDQDARGALQEAARVKPYIPDSCTASTKAALEGVLTTIHETVRRVFAQPEDLVIAPSSEEIRARKRVDDAGRYKQKMLDHGKGYDKSKTMFGKEYERSRIRNYKEKTEALSKKGDVEQLAEDAGRGRRDRIDGKIERLLDDLRGNVQKAVAAAGGSAALPDGTDGGLNSMTAMIETYARMLNRDAEARG
jgi:hypothetical protein